MKYREKARFISTMNLFSIKPDMNGDPNRVKSRIVALGNLDKKIGPEKINTHPFFV